MNQNQLQTWLAETRPFTVEGKVAQYIPALSDANPDWLGMAIVKGPNEIWTVGDVEQPFTLQSISKVLSLMVAMMDVGVEKVFQHVGMEPTGDPFNSIMKLELLQPSKPLNPMINAGAIAVSSLIDGATPQERIHRVIQMIQQMTHRDNVIVNQKVLQSELDTGDRNRALAYFMRDARVLRGDVEQSLEVYFGHCSIEVNSVDVAQIGYCLAHDGLNLWGERVVPADLARIAKTFMVTCGMYNASGEFAIRVGIPAKSGVSGGILALVPRQLGIGVFGPALDSKGNSVGGSLLLEKCSSAFDWSIF
jgi:glutaminase